MAIGAGLDKWGSHEADSAPANSGGYGGPRSRRHVRRPVNTATAPPAKFTVPRTWKAGAYGFYVYAKDKAGNAQSKVGSNRLTVK